MGAGDHLEVRELLGAYVLGQLASDDRSRLDDHLVGCASCRTELDELRPVAAALRQHGPPPHQVVGTARSRLRRAGVGLTLAACLTGAFALGGWYVHTRAAPAAVAVALRVLPPQVQADAGVVRHTWGTEFDLQATGLEAGGAYTVTFVDDDGRRIPGGSFLGTGSVPVRCQVSAALETDAAREVVITDRAGAVVIDAELG